MTSVPPPIKPTGRVQSFVNQRLNAFRPTTGGVDTSGLPAMQRLQTPAGGAGGVGLGTGGDRAISSLQRQREAYGRNTQARIAAKQAQQARTERSAVSTVGGGYDKAGLGSAGTAWKPDGSLSDSRNTVLSEASKYLGTPYVLGGKSTKGIDCSGLVMMVYNKLGYNINRHSATWQGRNIPGVRTSIKNLRPGDVVAWKDGSHIAIYAGNGEIIEAANPKRGTLRRKLWAPESAVFGIALRLPGE